MVRRFHGGLPPVHARSEVVDISVDDDDGVVDNHSQRHDEGRKGDGVQLQVEDIEQTEGDEDRDRHRGRCHGCHLARHDEHDDEQHGADSDEQLTQEVVNGIVDNLLLIGNLTDVYVSGQVGLDMFELLVDRRSHRGDVRTLLVGHGEQQRLRAVHSDVLGQVGVFKLHRCHIFEPHDLSARIRVDDRVLHIVGRVQALIDMNRTAIDPVAHIAACAREAFTCQLLRHGDIRDAVFGQARGIEIDVDLRVLFTREAHLTHGGNHAERVLHDHHIAPQLTVSLVLTLQRDQLRGDVAEVVLHLHG